jgi:hypothetical protein
MRCGELCPHDSNLTREKDRNVSSEATKRKERDLPCFYVRKLLKVPPSVNAGCMSPRLPSSDTFAMERQ